MKLMKLVLFGKLRNVMTRKHWAYISTTAVLVLLSHILGIQTGKSITFSTSENIKKGSADEILPVTEELELCLLDQAKVGPSQTKNYELATFGIYSPLFENEAVDYQLFTYNRSTIEARTIRIGKQNKSIPYVTITTWKLKPGQHYLRPLSRELFINEPLLHYKLYDFPIFDGYEFQTHVDPEKFVSARFPENPDASSVYTSAREIRMYRSKLSCPKTDCGAELHFLGTIEDGKIELFVQISSGIYQFSAYSEQPADIAIYQAFKEVEMVADTIDLNVY